MTDDDPLSFERVELRLRVGSKGVVNYDVALTSEQVDHPMYLGYVIRKMLTEVERELEAKEFIA